MTLHTPGPARQAGPTQRPGFTLVELLVSISIIILLAGLTVAFLPTVQEQQRSADAGVQLQRWLSVAQQRARRDQAARGLRLLVGPNVPTQVVSCQYLEQPDDFFVQGSSVAPYLTAGGSVVTPILAGIAGTCVSFTGVDFYQGFGPADPTLFAVQPGDFLEVNGGGVVHQIVALIPNTGGATCSTLQLAPVLVTGGNPAVGKGVNQITLNAVNNISLGCYLDLDYGTANAESVVVTKITSNTLTINGTNAGTANPHPLPPTPPPYTVQTHGIASFGPGTTYRIIRAPRITGDELLQLPTNIAIDLQTNATYGNTLPAGSNIDIMFAPNGTVTVRGVTGAVSTLGVPQDFLALWVRDLNAGPSINGAAEFELSPTLIAVYTRTGFIAAHPPTVAPPSFPPPSGYNPYKFLFDGLPQ